MAGYTPLFGSIVRSSIWDEDNATRIVWITMLALAEADGTIEGSIKGMAHEARVTLTECKTALEILKAPDPYSKTTDNDGRRIREIDGGWLVLNHKLYREKAKSRAGYMRQYREEKKKEHEEEKKENSNINSYSNNVTPCNTSVTGVTVTDSPLPPTKKRHLDFVMLTDDEYKKLIEKLGQNRTEQYIERLNNYVGSKGKRYKSHYHTILNWSSKDNEERGSKIGSSSENDEPFIR